MLQKDWLKKLTYWGLMVFRKRKISLEDESVKKLLRKKLLIPIFILFIVTFFYGGYKLFMTDSQNIKADNVFCAGNLNQEINLIDKNIFTIKYSDLKNQLQKKYLCIKDIKLVKKYPNKIDIEVYGRKPQVIFNFSKEASSSVNLVLLEASSSSQAAKVIPNIFEQKTYSEKKIVADDTGFLYTEAKGELNIPEIEVVNSDIPKMGSFVLSNYLKGYVFLRYLNSKGFNIQKSKIVSDFVLAFSGVYDQKNIKLLFNLNKDKDQQLASLQVILQKATIIPDSFSDEEIESKEIESIDLRFDKPVVVYSKK